MSVTLRNYGIEINGQWYIEPLIKNDTRGQIRTSFDISVTPGEALSYGDIRIYNLAGARSDNTTAGVTQTVAADYSRQKYDAKLPEVGSAIRLSAGFSTFDTDGNIQNEMRDFIFTGTITNIFREREGPNIVTHIYCTSLNTLQDKPLTDSSYANGVRLLDVIKDIAATWGKPLIINEADFSSIILTSGYVLFNDCQREMNTLARAYKFDWSISQGSMVVQYRGKQRKNVPDFILNAFTGLVGVPEITLGVDGLGVTATAKLLPYISYDTVFEIQSDYSVVNSGTNLFNVNQQNTTANGVYNVFGFRHRGDTHGNIWQTEIQGLSPDTQSKFSSTGKLIWGTKVDQAFRIKVRQVATNLGVDANWLMAIMYFESKFSTTVKNPMSTATGLIQFTRGTAISLGTTTVKLARMTAVEQLDYVEKYFNQFKGRLTSFTDTYMAVFYPNAMGKPDSFIIATSPSETYNANANLDKNRNGTITRGEAMSPVNDSYRNGLNNAV